MKKLAIAVLAVFVSNNVVCSSEGKREYKRLEQNSILPKFASNYLRDNPKLNKALLVTSSLSSSVGFLYGYSLAMENGYGLEALTAEMVGVLNLFVVIDAFSREKMIRMDPDRYKWWQECLGEGK